MSRLCGRGGILVYLIADFETRSEAEITEVGLHNYAIHPSTRALFLGWRIVKDLEDRATPMELWGPMSERMPAELLIAIEDPAVDIIAHNSAFERYIFKYVIGIEIPVERFQDTHARDRKASC